MRRIPTQLMESALALGIGAAALSALLVHGTAGGAVFVVSVAGYTLARQAILRLRAERRNTAYGGWLVAITALFVLLADVGHSVFGAP